MKLRVNAHHHRQSRHEENPPSSNKVSAEGQEKHPTTRPTGEGVKRRGEKSQGQRRLGQREEKILQSTGTQARSSAIVDCRTNAGVDNSQKLS